MKMCVYAKLNTTTALKEISPLHAYLLVLISRFFDSTKERLQSGHNIITNNKAELQLITTSVE